MDIRQFVARDVSFWYYLAQRLLSSSLEQGQLLGGALLQQVLKQRIVGLKVAQINFEVILMFDIRSVELVTVREKLAIPKIADELSEAILCPYICQLREFSVVLILPDICLVDSVFVPIHNVVKQSVAACPKTRNSVVVQI